MEEEKKWAENSQARNWKENEICYTQKKSHKKQRKVIRQQKYSQGCGRQAWRTEQP